MKEREKFDESSPLPMLGYFGVGVRLPAAGGHRGEKLSCPTTFAHGWSRHRPGVFPVDHTVGREWQNTPPILLCAVHLLTLRILRQFRHLSDNQSKPSSVQRARWDLLPWQQRNRRRRRTLNCSIICQMWLLPALSCLNMPRPIAREDDSVQPLEPKSTISDFPQTP
ncbi:hypothetical protein BC567DRAFT_6091 [Phyllosticta citribraziliensis]